MYLKILIAVFFASTAMAQPVDLRALPSDYSFTSQGEDGVTTVSYLGQDGDLFKFIFVRDASQGNPSQETAWLSAGSQTVRFTRGDRNESYYPHDCAPFLGVCDFIAKVLSGEKYEVSRSTFMVGDVWVDRVYVIVDGERMFFSQGCTTYDEFGFWIDSVAEDFDGEQHFGRRISSSVEPAMGTSFEALQDMCRNAEELVS